MGMDAWLFAVPISKVREIQAGSNLEALGFEEPELHALCYWRRHYPLHDWMEALFKKKGGVVKETGFNGQYTRLLASDLAKLDEDIRSGKVRDTEMLLGTNEDTLRGSIPAARNAIAEGKAVFYFASY
jgi:hypothetical protein